MSHVDAMSLMSVGLAEVGPDEREQLQLLLDCVIPRDAGPLKCTTWVEHEIDVGSVRPIKQRYYSVSEKIEEDMYAQVRGMLHARIIEPSSSGWPSPIVMVKEVNGSYRMCIDFRKVNTLSKANAYPLPHIYSILRKLHNAKYISTLDLSGVYHQIPLKKESRPITAFTVPGMGLGQYTRMPYGLEQAGATFQRLVDRVIGPELEPYAYSYLDDRIVVIEMFEEHLQRLEHALSRIREAGCYDQPGEKCLLR